MQNELFMEQDFVQHGHQMIFHLAANVGDQVKALVARDVHGATGKDSLDQQRFSLAEQRSRPQAVAVLLSEVIVPEMLEILWKATTKATSRNTLFPEGFSQN
ncbi:MAG: hypothetical protein TE42_09975 [Candidatus Synechococcus spongiarum SP3]|uniref:Uncharacterized protein n=1 Tax=Candidatus Synechococcus spongiarum SP3 TaxID=1604020 RepID=A0A0G2HJ31_9SYNE|nr:MAG: hypothetical protein TE42_09975 [Candidatus Synechococcus spongiarum SP3]